MILTFGLILSMGYEVLKITSLGSRSLLHIASAIMFMNLNIGIYASYFKKIKRSIIYYLAAAIFIPLLLFLTSSLKAELSLSIIEFAAVCISWLLISPYIGETIKHRVSLIIYLCIVVGNAETDLWQTEKWILIIFDILPVIYYFILLLILIERFITMFQSVVNSSLLDGLTGLYNRKAISTRIKQCVEKGECAIVFTDIDNFKELNDTLGHHAGDAALKTVAEILQEETDDIGFPGRYGGEELIAVIDDKDTISRIEEWAENFRSRVERESNVTLSIGFSIYRYGLTPEKLLEQADLSMYSAKRTGKNKIVEYKDGLDTGSI
ncbi:GGDEF domain-containing protein [Paenibacillus sp. P36]|uniref:GGDEF domain-containing protein n=1 Tax=Paenibacillus sp. P36 TaxID=3342538 RepID=UPI0038B3E735